LEYRERRDACFPRTGSVTLLGLLGLWHACGPQTLEPGDEEATGSATASGTSAAQTSGSATDPSMTVGGGGGDPGPDPDGDGVASDSDNCPGVPNPRRVVAASWWPEYPRILYVRSAPERYPRPRGSP